VISSAIEEARALIDEAARVTVLTGAGISTDSGIQDFRGPRGLWTLNPGAERKATLQHYMSNPEARKESWRNRAGSPAWTAQPNAGHRALVELERRGKLVALATQNVDGLHQAAGSDPAKVIELHGTMREVNCMMCGERAPMERALARVQAGEEDPPCRSCGGILKAATISFGQNLVERDIMRADQAARECDLLLAAGSTLGVTPAAYMVPTAKSVGAQIVIVNAEPTEYDYIADALLRGSISEILPAILRDESQLPGGDGPA
jgi:NAD-dependent deacetylase